MAIKNLKPMRIILIILFNILSLGIYAQCDYEDFSDAPEELFRKRVKEDGMRYGNPYTMFLRDDKFNL